MKERDMPDDMLVYRVGQLEGNYGKLDEKMDKLLTNEMPCIQKELLALKTRMNVLTAVNVFAIVFGIVVSRLPGA